VEQALGSSPPEAVGGGLLRLFCRLARVGRRGRGAGVRDRPRLVFFIVVERKCLQSGLMVLLEVMLWRQWLLLKWMVAMLMEVGRGGVGGGVIQELRRSKKIWSGGDRLVAVELDHVRVEQSQLEVELGLLWGRQVAVVVLHLAR
jgi:hypothetical protein